MLLLNQAGLPRGEAEDAADEAAWRQHLRAYGQVKAALTLDAFYKSFAEIEGATPLETLVRALETGFEGAIGVTERKQAPTSVPPEMFTIGMCPPPATCSFSQA